VGEQVIRCNTLQHIATQYSWTTGERERERASSTLRLTASHCNTLQHTAHCNTLQHTATHNNTQLDVKGERTRESEREQKRARELDRERDGERADSGWIKGVGFGGGLVKGRGGGRVTSVTNGANVVKSVNSLAVNNFGVFGEDESRSATCTATCVAAHAATHTMNTFRVIGEDEWGPILTEHADIDGLFAGGHVLQRVAACCSVLQCVAVGLSWLKTLILIRCLQVGVCCSVLQHVAACCSVWQRVAACSSVLQRVAVCCNVLQCVAVCFSVSVLADDAECDEMFAGRYVCSVLQRVAACCSVLQRVAVCCSVLQWACLG